MVSTEKTRSWTSSALPDFAVQRDGWIGDIRRPGCGGSRDATSPRHLKYPCIVETVRMLFVLFNCVECMFFSVILSILVAKVILWRPFCLARWQAGSLIKPCDSPDHDSCSAFKW